MMVSLQTETCRRSSFLNFIVGAASLILNCFNNSPFLTLRALVGQLSVENLFTKFEVIRAVLKVEDF
jgi:hypothetical protein